MTHYYCSTYSKDYIYKGLVLYNSLKKYDQDFHFFFICLQDEVKYLLERMQLSNVTLISMKDIENEDWELANIKSSRNDKEYVWTSKASTLLYLFNHFSEIDHIIWLDGDTAFLSDTQPIFDEWGDYSILLTEEKYTGKYEWLSKIYGVYNTGFIGFKRDQNALGCIQWFREKLIEWCFDRPEEGRWSDQMYVNDWITRFNNVGVVRNIGINANLFILQDRMVTRVDDNVYINGDRLVLFHYYGFKYYNRNEFDLCAHGNSLTDQVIQWIFLPYIQACNEVIDWMGHVNKEFYCRQNIKNKFVMNYFRLENSPNEEKEKYNFCTIIDSAYLLKGLALYDSLRRHAKKFRLWICCMDHITYDTLANMGLEGVVLIDVKNIEDKELLNIKGTRNVYEYCRTLKAPLVLHILRNNYYVDYVACIDADLFFFSDPGKMFDDWENGSIFIYQRKPGKTIKRKTGIYQAGLIGFRRDENALKCLWRWRKKYIECYYDRVERHRWVDQKYMDKWPYLFPGVKIITNQGVNAGPWNIRSYSKQIRNNKIYCEHNELIAYHFSGLRIFNESEFDICWYRKISKKVIRMIYMPYIATINELIETVTSNGSNLTCGFCDNPNTMDCRNYLKYIPEGR